MDTISLKKYIRKNDKVEFILEQIGCKNIKYHPYKEYYSCANKDGDNNSAVNVYNNDYLGVKNWTREKDFDDKSDIITLVQYNMDFDFIQAVKWLHKILVLSYKSTSISPKKTVEHKNPLAIFEKYLTYKTNVRDIEFLENSLMDYYVPLLYIGWLREGITAKTAKKFGLAYSYKRNRIIIPIHDWLSGKLVGINQRTVIEDWELLGIKKYYITPHYKKHLNLYGLYENYNSIKKAGHVVVAESEKSVLKRDSLCDSTVVALSGHTLSDEQVRILVGLNVEIVIALDKDVPLQETQNMCEKFYHIRPVSYMYDKWDIIGEKDSPMDAENKIYKFLFEHRTKYNDIEHKKFMHEIGKGKEK